MAKRGRSCLGDAQQGEEFGYRNLRDPVLLKRHVEIRPAGVAYANAVGGTDSSTGGIAIALGDELPSDESIEWAIGSGEEGLVRIPGRVF